ncbi:hypothetical protein M427DRAFT_59057 [Gonapodya prolifera JEL478]|uniref:Uncharacterized protein n=1 Tax=Gonapodya prolifera (strain JEL478) TaxID=1344416 RepID=A0A139A818_GONPJ|nr:hypothetical protein M427DRAFT_59057 [Gonapodya prolifera JEL478]|eukprot:KXS12946.1 hypothetical protein M427DRAFT_59057 [Gonapodya prolifera JEL478]
MAALAFFAVLTAQGRDMSADTTRFPTIGAALLPTVWECAILPAYFRATLEAQLDKSSTVGFAPRAPWIAPVRIRQ